MSVAAPEATRCAATRPRLLLVGGCGASVLGGGPAGPTRLPAMATTLGPRSGDRRLARVHGTERFPLNGEVVAGCLKRLGIKHG